MLARGASHPGRAPGRSNHVLVVSKHRTIIVRPPTSKSKFTSRRSSHDADGSTAATRRWRVLSASPTNCGSPSEAGRRKWPSDFLANRRRPPSPAGRPRIRSQRPDFGARYDRKRSPRNSPNPAPWVPLHCPNCGNPRVTEPGRTPRTPAATVHHRWEQTFPSRPTAFAATPTGGHARP